LVFLLGKGGGAANQSFLLGRISPNFDLKNNDFDLYKEFFIEKMAQIRQISNQKGSKSADFFDNFYKLPKIWKISA